MILTRLAWNLLNLSHSDQVRARSLRSLSAPNCAGLVELDVISCGEIEEMHLSQCRSLQATS